MKDKLARKVNKIVSTNKKRVYQLLNSYHGQKSILFIVGCQRSGTSMMLKVFNKDLNTGCFGEFSSLVSSDTTWGIRLNSLDLVEKEFSKVHAPFIVVKTLVESQNIPELLSYFDNSKALWLFRNYKDVASSNLRHFGLDNGIKNLGYIINNEPNNWRTEKLSNHVRDTIAKYYSETMNPYDAAVLFWFVRNSIFFDLGLDKNPRVLMCNYADFVMQPDRLLRTIYRQLGQIYPENDITSGIHSHSINKGKEITLMPEVQQLAQDMWNKLELAYKIKDDQPQNSEKIQAPS